MTDTKIGRPKVQVDMVKLAQLLDFQVPKSKIAVQLGVSRKTLYKVIREGGLND